MVLILPEREEFHSAIHEINVLAFGGENEARLLENLRKSCSFNAQLSLVASFSSCPGPCAHGCSSGIPESGNWLQSCEVGIGAVLKS